MPHWHQIAMSRLKRTHVGPNREAKRPELDALLVERAVGRPGDHTLRKVSRYHETVFHRIALLLVAFVLILLALTAVILFSARRSLLAGVTDLQSAQDRIQLVTAHTSLRSTLGEVRADIMQSQGNFQSADDRLSLVAPLIEHLGW